MRFRKGRLAACVLIGLVIMMPVSVLGSQSSDDDCVKEWTMLVFWCADNNLEFCTEFAMDAWERALTSNDEVNVIAMVDLLSVNGTWIYEVEGEDSRVVKEYPELNTSDPAVLKMFVEYGMETYPSEKTLLVVQDHGFGWRGMCKDETNGSSLMSVDGLANALVEVKDARDGKGVDLLAFDACSMSTIEVAYEFRNAVSYLVSSQTVVPYDGLPYMMTVSDMVADPDMSPEELAADIVEDYVEYYSDRWNYEHIYSYSQDYSTVAALNMSHMQEVGDAFIDFTEVLSSEMDKHLSHVMSARMDATIGNWANIGGWEWQPDLGVFMEDLVGVISPELDATIEDFFGALDAAMVLEAHSDRYDGRVHGLNVYFPPSQSMYDSCAYWWAKMFVYHESNLDIVSESRWYECLMKYYGTI
ncbi:MAG: hypothetical protein IH630_04840 [Thermoplasmata archaeon]|nr:hypothetical protein [Thermoplasmata archaeon]